MNAIHRRSIPRSRLFARLLRILLLLAIAMQVYWPPPAHAATTLTVTSTEDSGPGTLRDAIAAATGGDTIDFDGALSGQTITLLSPLLLNKDLTIDGSAIAAPVTLSGGGAVRILEVAEGATVWVLGLVFEDGQASEAQGEGLANQGGAIRNAGTLTLTRCTLTGNRGYQGAAIHNATAGYLTVSECTISGNHASNSGGGIWSVGTLALHGSVISGNSAEGTGGGFYSVSSQENVVTACTFEANTAMGGGAIHAGGRLTVADSTFYMNTAGIAGAIANSGTLTLTNSTLVANAATGAPILPMIGAGGLLNLQWATIRHSTFAGNSAAEGLGGGIVNTYALGYANTIVAGSTGGDCVQVSGSDPGAPLSYAITGNTGNLVEDGSCEAEFSGDPLLGPLADNGGPTQTMALLAGSPAIDAGDAGASVSVDQRGVTRPQGVAPDIGAHELRTPVAATTGDADGVTVARATLHGVVTAGDRAGVTFEVGTTDEYGTTLPAAPGVLTGTAESAVSAALTGLLPGTTYHYRVVATNEAGVVRGAEETFTTAVAPPLATTDPAEGVTASGATLKGRVTAQNDPTEVTFAYGLSTAYGSEVAATPQTVTGLEETGVTAALAGLLPHQTYHYRVVATNTTGTTVGGDEAFTTLPVAPTATTRPAGGVGTTGAVLEGTVNAHGAEAQVWFVVAPPDGDETTVAAAPSPVTGRADTAVSAAVAGLVPNTTYTYRVVAVNAAGETAGPEATFTTAPAPPVAVTGAYTAVGATGVVLRGTVNARNAAATVTFSYGPTVGYGTTLAAEPEVVTGTGDVAVMCILDGLEPGTTYHYRVEAENAGGRMEGADGTFATGGAGQRIVVPLLMR